MLGIVGGGLDGALGACMPLAEVVRANTGGAGLGALLRPVEELVRLRTGGCGAGCGSITEVARGMACPLADRTLGSIGAVASLFPSKSIKLSCGYIVDPAWLRRVERLVCMST